MVKNSRKTSPIIPKICKKTKSLNYVHVRDYDCLYAMRIKSIFFHYYQLISFQILVIKGDALQIYDCIISKFLSSTTPTSIVEGLFRSFSNFINIFERYQ